MKHIFIVNPYTCKDKTNGYIETIENLCHDLGESYDVYQTEYIGHAEDITKRFTKEDDVCIYSVGGDGTAYEVANGLQKDVPMAIIPAGTSNDFFRMLGLNADNIPHILKETIIGKEILIDYGKCNDKIFLNTTTMGLDARVNHMVCEMLKKTFLPKFMLYGVAAITNIFNPQPFNATIATNNSSFNVKSILIAVMNGRYYGNGFSPTRYADIQDGEFDICIVHNTSTPRMLHLLPKYFKGKTENIKEVTHLKANKITIKANHPVHIQSDGENYMQHELCIEIVNKGLHLRIPHSATIE
ncbi:MAG: diacylglycerol/lipid kinase family protein [Anaerorhabdus sp.]|uniref:diacylglycerol/lipid kinase family protein n=1 Tax=Anaerorhabdus sp. TaxID=1872524 RepID=UPI003A86DDA3